MTNVDRFREIAKELGDLYEKKNLAYGNSFSDTYNKLGIISAITRISDKFNRLCNIAKNPNIDNLGENLEDTLRDMASYCIMTVMELENAMTIGMDMQGNTVLTKDVVMREYITDKQIHKGDVFKCIQHVIMEDGSVAYVEGKIYASEKDDCITNDENDENHEWRTQENHEDNWWHYFKRI